MKVATPHTIESVFFYNLIAMAVIVETMVIEREPMNPNMNQIS